MATRPPPAATTAAEPSRAERAHTVLIAILGTAFLVSIIHYTDNYLGYEHYPQPESGPNPSASVILLAWFVFTAFGVAGYLLFRRSRMRAAAACLAVYSLSGLVGLGHYAVPGVGRLEWWRHAHILVDVACGAAVLAFAGWLRARSSQRSVERG
ncbi:MAG: hypothetical protein ACRDRK_18020 [Pseudonocardia sp.]